MTDVVLGLDLSTRGLGMCAVPADWDLDFRRVRLETLARPLSSGASNADKVRRLLALAGDVRRFADRVRASHVWAESVPTFGYNLVTLAKLRCAVDLELCTYAGIVVEDANQSSARKLLLGWLPKADLKATVFELLQAASENRFRDNDQADAFTVANYGLSELGAPCLAGLAGAAPVRQKRGKRQGKAA